MSSDDDIKHFLCMCEYYFVIKKKTEQSAITLFTLFEGRYWLREGSKVCLWN